MITDMLMPCSPGDPGAMEMSWMDIPGEKLIDMPVTYEDFLKSLKCSKPTVSKDDVAEQLKWMEEFGQEG